MRVLIVIYFLLVLTGCAVLPGQKADRCQDPADCLLMANHQAVEKLLAGIPVNKQLKEGKPIIVASLVNIDDLKSSRLGRMLAEQVATKMTNSGYSVVELKLRDNIFVKQMEGELLLSRELKDITINHQAQAVLVGTYAESRGHVYVTLKLVGVADNLAISAYDYVLPLDSTVRSLLWAKGN